MKKRIVIEMEAEASGSGLIQDITALVMNKIDSDVEFKIEQEIIPETISREIQIPSFMTKGAKRGAVCNG